MRPAWLGTATALGVAASGLASAEESARSSINLPVGVTPISAQIYDLHMMIFIICTVIAAGVFGVMFYSILRHRKSVGHKAATFHESTTIEVIWTVIPFFILVGVAIPSAKTLIAMEDTRNSELTIKITGYQWKWQYEYMDSGVSFFSTINAEHNAARQTGSGIDVSQFPNYLKDVDNPLVIPVGQKVRFLMTSADVIHSWWVPDFGIKKDAIPGYIRETWAQVETPGVYRGKCTELCGRDHGFMPVVVRAVPEEEFIAWMDEQQGGASASTVSATMELVEDAPAAELVVAQAATDMAVEVEAEVAEVAADVTTEAEAAVEPEGETVVAGLDKEALMARGQAVYGANCVACHQAGGQGIPGVFPAITGSAVATGDVAAHIKVIRDGVPGTAMMSFKGSLSDEDIAAVVTFQRNALGNAVGDVVQAADVAALP